MKKTIKKNVLVCILVGAMLHTSACSNGDSSSVAATTTEATVTTEVTATEEAISTEKTINEEITSFDEVNTDKVKIIALGNSDVPVGQYSQKVFENLGFWDAIQNKISYGTNVKEVLSQVEEGSVDCGVVYATDAATSDGVTVVCSAPEESLDSPVLYPAAILSKSANADAATVFMNYLLTNEALAEFKKIGFKIATDKTATDMSYDGGACTLNVFAAASLTESLSAIKELFVTKYPKIDLVLNFDSSGTLQKQIEAGAEADIFFSAAEKQMTALKDEGYIVEDTIADLLENEVVLVVPAK